MSGRRSVVRRPALLSVGVLFAASTLPALAQNRASAPRQLPGEVRAACDMAYRIATNTPGASVRRRTGTFADETLRRPVFGCGLDIAGSFKRAEKTGDASVRLRDSFMGAEWQEMGAYGADGTDGTSFAFRKGAVACLARGMWNGGADDPQVPPEDWYKVAFFCTSPAFPDQR
jgi:hypothetical protein